MHSRSSTAGTPTREKVTSRMRVAVGLAPGSPYYPRSARPSVAPALAQRPSPAGPHRERDPAAERAHASRRAHSMVRCGRGGCRRRDAASGAHERRAFSQRPRSAAPQVRRQVGAAAAHMAGRTRGGLCCSGRLRAPPAAGPGPRSCRLRRSGGVGGSPGV
jgi:hypothetical protein